MKGSAEAASAPTEGRSRRAKRPGTTGRWILVGAVAVVVVLAGLGIGSYLSAHDLYPFQSGEPTLTVYTYDSLWGGCGSQNLTGLMNGFESTHHARVSVECVSGTLSSKLIAERDAPAADLVIGLDEITAPQADAAGVLIPYAPPELAGESPSLLAEIAPDHSVAPYEFGYLGIDYTTAIDEATGGAVMNASLPDFAANATWARDLMIENPETDIVGQEFLLSEIAFYENVLHENWTTFWTSVDPSIRVSDSWSDAYTAFTTPPDSPPMLLSFSTDPPAAVGGGTVPAFNATVYHWNGSKYAWRTIYGIGIVKGTKHLALDEAFEDWFLEGGVQSEIPTNEWVYPANTSTPVPAGFHWAANASGALVLNDGLALSSIPSELPGWLDQWQSIENRLAG